MEGQSLQGLGNGKRYIPIRFVKYFDLRENKKTVPAETGTVLILRKSASPLSQRKAYW